MPLVEYQQLSHNLNEWMICIVPILKKVVDLLLELDKLLFSFEVCRRFMLGLLVLLPWCLLMAMVLSISLCSICFRSKCENLFEEGNHLYRFLDHDPIVMSQCHNIPRVTTEVKPKPMIEISSRLRFLSYAIFEAYASEDGKHVDYRSIHGSEEFARYLRIVEELQRVDLQDMTREEKMAFSITNQCTYVIKSRILKDTEN
ncbi:hypothetical protein LOK49_LG05G01917 [Camellia lanceoleosa]|uniref:Uncharacterized protein n=1 Tax=Camellia lanceoleosa TaxID=1840588 RepID=A0ACC0HSW6_9ERIC|nr:hypothetical protein LOK49_LG05G01917 [Camellia lanceoleosa]